MSIVGTTFILWRFTLKYIEGDVKNIILTKILVENHKVYFNSVLHEVLKKGMISRKVTATFKIHEKNHFASPY